MAGGKRWLSRARAADLALWLVVMAPVFPFTELPDAHQAVGVPLWWTQLAAVPLLTAAVFAGRRWPTVAAAVPAVLGMAATPELHTNNYLVAQVLLAYLLGRRAAERGALLLFGAIIGVGLVLLPVSPSYRIMHFASLIFLVLTAVVVPWLIGRYARQQAELVRTGWELAERLEREHELVGDRVRLRERSRIARDMHDSLGHDLSMIALRAAALQVAPDVGANGRRAAAELRQAAAAATKRLHDVVAVLRQDNEDPPILPAGDTVRSLADRAVTSGMAVTLIDEAPPLPPMADRAVYRVVQEALTNAMKHAPGSPVTVTLRHEGAEVVVIVINRTTATPKTPTGSGGHGLVGLDERVRLAGGTLQARPVNSGFAVIARLPLTTGVTVTTPTGASTSQHELALARRRLHRNMINAMWVPAGAIAALLLLWLGSNFYQP